MADFSLTAPPDATGAPAVLLKTANHSPSINAPLASFLPSPLIHPFLVPFFFSSHPSSPATKVDCHWIPRDRVCVKTDHFTWKTADPLKACCNLKVKTKKLFSIDVVLMETLRPGHKLTIKAKWQMTRVCRCEEPRLCSKAASLNPLWPGCPWEAVTLLMNWGTFLFFPPRLSFLLSFFLSFP